MEILHYILDENGEAVPEPDLLTWARWFELASRDGTRQVANDFDEGDETKTIRVSTVFLGLDHNFGIDGPPVLWETLVFGGLLDGEMDRYSSRTAALLGHQAMCERVMKTLEKTRPGEGHG